MKKLLFSTAFFCLLAIVSCNKDQDKPGDDGGSGTSVKGVPQDSLVDSRDNKKYATVLIDGRVWMAQNLAYDAGTGTVCYDDDCDSYLEDYGYLYSFEAAKTACPDGYHLPTDEEWKALEKYLGMPEEQLDMLNQSNRDADIAKYLKSGGAVNFNVVYSSLQLNGDFGAIGFNSYIWSDSTDTGIILAREISKTNDRVNRASFSTNSSGNKACLRCIKDE